jgi:hypothetical protein
MWYNWRHISQYPAAFIDTHGWWRVLRNVSALLPDHTESHTRRWPCSSDWCVYWCIYRNVKIIVSYAVTLGNSEDIHQCFWRKLISIIMQLQTRKVSQPVTAIKKLPFQLIHCISLYVPFQYIFWPTNKLTNENMELEITSFYVTSCWVGKTASDVWNNHSTLKIAALPTDMTLQSSTVQYSTKGRSTS